MFRSLCRGAMLSVILGAGLWAQRGPGRMPPIGGPGKQAALIERWSRMAPDQRERALAKLPPERRRRIEEQLSRYQNLNPEQRQQLRFRAEMFNQLPPEKQEAARRLFRQFNQLREERQTLVREEFNSLRAMRPAERRDRINSEDFRKKYDDREQMFLRQFSRLLNPAR